MKIDLPLRAVISQPTATAPHIADLSLLARGDGAVGAFHAHLALVRIVQTDETQVLLHSLGDTVPESGVERCIFVPPGARTVGVASGIFKAVGRTTVVKAGVVRDIAVESVCLVDVEVARVDLVKAEAAVHVGHGCHAGHDPAASQRSIGVLDTAVVGIVHHELVLVIVAPECIGNHMRRVPVHDLVEQVGRVGQWVVSVPAAENMAHDPDPLTRVFGLLQLVNHPGEDTRVVGVSGVDQVEVIGLVPEV